MAGEAGLATALGELETVLANRNLVPSLGYHFQADMSLVRLFPHLANEKGQKLTAFVPTFGQVPAYPKSTNKVWCIFRWSLAEFVSVRSSPLAASGNNFLIYPNLQYCDLPKSSTDVVVLLHTFLRQE